MKKLTWIFCLLLLNTSLLAEIIDGPANLRVTSKGEIAVSLLDGVEVYVDSKEGDWYKILFIAYVSKDQYKQTKYLDANIDLFDYKGRKIGTTKNSFSNFEYFEEGNKIGLNITLFTYKSNIVDSSIIEKEIVSLINSNNLNLNSIEKLDYLSIGKWANVEGYSGGVVLEPLLGGPFPPGIRFIFFINQQEIVAMVSNDKLKDYHFSCIGMTEIEELRLNVFYFNEEIHSIKKTFEKSLFAAFSKMN